MIDILALAISLGSALGIGIIAGLAPCVLTGNIAAVACVSRQASHPSRTMIAGLMYAAGRVVAYSIIGMALLFSGRAVLESFEGLTSYISVVLAVLFITTGAVVIGALKPNFSFGHGLTAKYAEVSGRRGPPGAFGLGLLFALAFCPVLASLFFGLLMPLALESDAGILLPALFGIGTALPIFVFAVLLTRSVARAEAYAGRVRAVEPLIHKLFGAGLIIYGIFLLIQSIS